jgi:hypothetical protein
VTNNHRPGISTLATCICLQLAARQTPASPVSRIGAMIKFRTCCIGLTGLLILGRKQYTAFIHGKVIADIMSTLSATSATSWSIIQAEDEV